jgi:cell division septal protein FtsQ
MPLVPCRACGHQVDTSALACPRCGATDPAKKISRQRRELRNFVIQTIFWLSLLGVGGWYVWTNVIPAIKQFVVKPQIEQTQNGK